MLSRVLNNRTTVRIRNRLAITIRKIHVVPIPKTIHFTAIVFKQVLDFIGTVVLGRGFGKGFVPVNLTGTKTERNH